MRGYTFMHPHPSTAYLRLSEGPDDLLANELSFTRRLLIFCVAIVLFSGTSLFATAAFDLDHALVGKALAATGKASDDDGEDNSGPGGGDDDDDTNNAVTSGGASHSDDNDDGDSDSSTHQNVQRVKADDSNSDHNHDGDSDSSHGASLSMRSQATSDGRGDHTRG